MDAFIGQRFEDFETIAGVNVIKLYGDSLLSARLDAQSVGEILVRLVEADVSVQAHAEQLQVNAAQALNHVLIA